MGAFAGLETVTHISDLNSSWPLGSDLASTSDDHIRNIKTALKTDFPNIGATVSSASAPPFAPYNDTNTGLYFPSADDLALATGGTKRFEIGSAGNATLSAPSSGVPLTINGTTGGGGFINGLSTVNADITSDFSNTSTGTAATSQLRVANNAAVFAFGITSTGFSGSPLTGGPSGQQAFVNTASIPISIGTNSTERVRIGSAGNISINAPSSGTAVTVTAASGGLALSTIGTNTGASNQSYINFLDSGSTRKGYVGDAATGTSDIVVASDAGTVNLFPSAGQVSVTGSATGASNVSYMAFYDSTGSGGTRKGYVGDASASTSDTVMESDAGNISLIPVSSTGVIQGSTDGGSTFVDMTPAKGTFTGTLTGMTAGTTGTVNYVRMGNLVTVYVTANITGTSNTTAMTMTGLPSSIQPTNAQSCFSGAIENAGSGSQIAFVTISGGTITFNLILSPGTGNSPITYATTNFTNSSAKGVLAGWTITYAIG